MTAQSMFEPDCIRRYDREGPRYTSYPTAPRFHEGFGETEFRCFAERSNAALIPSPLSVYVHVPFCFNPCFYCGCTRVFTRDPARGEQYLGRLLHEIELVSPLFDRDREVVQLHLGGGTPNFLSAEQLQRLVRSISRHFHLSTAPDRDISIELDPRFINAAAVAKLADIGFNRASLGVQDFDPQVQAAINRRQSIETTREVIEACRASDFRSINVDLIYGLPRQMVAGFRRTLETVIDARPDRLAIYGYAHLPQMFKAQRQIRDEDLPDAETRLELLSNAVEMLESAGYNHIGLDHFALPDDDLSLAMERGSLHRNFMGYTTHSECDLIGLGVSAISHIDLSFSQNHRNLAEWEIAVDEGRLPVWRGLAMNFDDELRNHVIQGLMCRGEVDFNAVERRFGIDFKSYFESELIALGRLIDDGILRKSEAGIEATAPGRYLLRIIAMCFDAYRRADASMSGYFSKAI